MNGFLSDECHIFMLRNNQFLTPVSLPRSLGYNSPSHAGWDLRGKKSETKFEPSIAYDLLTMILILYHAASQGFVSAQLLQCVLCKKWQAYTLYNFSYKCVC